MRNDILYAGMHLLVLQPLLGGTAHHGAGNRVRKMLFQAGRHAQHLLALRAAERHHLAHHGLRLCQRARFVEHDGVRLGQRLQKPAALHRDAPLAALAHGAQHGQRHRSFSAHEKSTIKMDTVFCTLRVSRP